MRYYIFNFCICPSRPFFAARTIPNMTDQSIAGRDSAALTIENEMRTNKVRHSRSELARKAPSKGHKATSNPSQEPDATRKTQVLGDIGWLLNRLQTSQSHILFRGRRARRAIRNR